MNIKEKILLFLIIVIGFLFRVYGVNFDQTCCQHPDERAIVMFTLPIGFPASFEQFSKPTSPLNPHFFAYGNLPLYLLKSASLVASNFDPELAAYSKISLVGRSISITADIATIILIFLLGRLLFNARTGLAASFIYAVSVLPIQYSHFYTSDILLTMFVILSIFRIIKFYQKPNIKNAIYVGIVFGLSLATKISALPLVVAVSFAIIADFIFIFLKSPHKVKTWFPHIPVLLQRLIKEGLVIIGATIVSFAVSQPYAIIDFSEFLKQNLLQSQMTRDAYTFPYTLQYVGKIPYFYEIKNIFLFGLGPVIATLAFAGFLSLFKSLKTIADTKRAEILIVLTFFFFYFAIVGSFSIGFMRYLLPIYPILAIFAGLFLYKVLQIKLLLTIGIFLLIILWPISFMSIYSNPNTRIEATDWINQNIEENASLIVEHWDDRIPAYAENKYNFLELNLYDQPDDENKWQILSEKIQKSDYIIVASNRLYIPIQKLSDCKKYRVCYPIASSYYDKLFSRKLGFEKIKEFSSYPEIPILGLRIVDDSADESFTVYDHPKIMIFKKK